MAFSFSSTKSKKGFTLIELIIVVAIMGLLTAFIAFISSVLIHRARVARAQGDMNRIAKAIKQLEVDTGLGPMQVTLSPCAVTGGLDVLVDDSTAVGLANGLLTGPGSYANWKGPYIDQIPLDPWGNPYYFDVDYYCNNKSKGCEGLTNQQLVRAVSSYGPNGQRGPDMNYDEDNVAIVLCEN